MQTSLRFLFSCLLSSRHAELVSASHREPFLVLLRGQILKRVQDDICVLTAHRSLCAIKKFFTKPNFRINPAGKSKVPSWKIFISQLGNYFFSVGKSKFRSRAK